MKTPKIVAYGKGIKPTGGSDNSAVEAAKAQSPRGEITCPMADKPNKEYGGTEIATGKGTESYYDYTTRRSYGAAAKAHAKNPKGSMGY